MHAGGSSAASKDKSKQAIGDKGKNYIASQQQLASVAPTSTAPTPPLSRTRTKRAAASTAVALLAAFAAESNSSEEPSSPVATTRSTVTNTAHINNAEGKGELEGEEHDNDDDANDNDDTSLSLTQLKAETMAKACGQSRGTSHVNAASQDSKHTSATTDVVSTGAADDSADGGNRSNHISTSQSACMPCMTALAPQNQNHAAPSPPPALSTNEQVETNLFDSKALHHSRPASANACTSVLPSSGDTSAGQDRDTSCMSMVPPGRTTRFFFPEMPPTTRTTSRAPAQRKPPQKHHTRVPPPSHRRARIPPAIGLRTVGSYNTNWDSCSIPAFADTAAQPRASVAASEGAPLQRTPPCPSSTTPPQAIPLSGFSEQPYSATAHNLAARLLRHQSPMRPPQSAASHFKTASDADPLLVTKSWPTAAQPRSRASKLAANGAAAGVNSKRSWAEVDCTGMVVQAADALLQGALQPIVGALEPRKWQRLAKEVLVALHCAVSDTSEHCGELFEPIEARGALLPFYSFNFYI